MRIGDGASSVVALWFGRGGVTKVLGELSDGVVIEWWEVEGTTPLLLIFSVAVGGFFGEYNGQWDARGKGEGLVALANTAVRCERADEFQKDGWW
ncbi:hypothetical protein L6452_09638 [Arctium lappa]|uniref:Uncharacterized protein n=1 Tax=Arctium lappa TaxID=4217 RepID=A0ACB9DKV3_ARCLA|nr:hypothetical protein L6452_09638 [Arctium lappa]